MVGAIPLRNLVGGFSLEVVHPLEVLRGTWFSGVLFEPFVIQVGLGPPHRGFPPFGTLGKNPAGHFGEH